MSRYTLAANSQVEFLKGTGTTGLTLTGNAFSHNINGTSANDVLNGGSGNDTLVGGTAGADTMAGGAGNDTYLVDNAGDVVNEIAGNGTDTVLASVNYSLTAGSAIEFLRGTGLSGLSLSGNELANTVAGTVGNDTLDGGLGNDSLTGGRGQRLLQVPDGIWPGYRQ